MFGIILKNLLGYDLLIIILAVFAGFFLYPKATKASEALKDHLQPTLYIPIDVLLNQFISNNKKEIDLHGIKKLKDAEAKYVNMLLTIISVFPLMGILGTIISLLGMVNLGSEEVLINFTTALTSTFWGLVFAIGFKGLTSMLMAQNEQNIENFELLIKRVDMMNSTGDAHEKA